MFEQYTKTAAASTPESLVKSLVPGMSSVIDQLKAKDPYLSAKIMAKRRWKWTGQKIDCYVVEAKLDKISLPGSIEMSDGVQKVWVDKTTKLSLKQTMTATMTRWSSNSSRANESGVDGYFSETGRDPCRIPASPSRRPKARSR